MKACILFIDTDHAKIFNLNPGKMESHELKKHEVKHHNTSDKNDEHEKHFFHEVGASLRDTTELLLVGPGLAKSRFKTYLETHQKELAKKVVGMETVDHPTDPQIIAVGKEFFKDYDLFH